MNDTKDVERESLCAVEAVNQSDIRSKKEKEMHDLCDGPQMWDYKNEATWRIYMEMFVMKTKRRVEEKLEERGEFHRRRLEPEDIPRVPDPTAAPPRFELNAFNLEGYRICPWPRVIYERFRTSSKRVKQRKSKIVSSDSIEFPKVAPCSRRDVVRERKILARKQKMKETGGTPCEIDEIDSPDSSEDEKLQELANLKELGHVRIPVTYPKVVLKLLVDRVPNETPCLVGGDYVTFKLRSKDGNRTYANICLRGLTGMHMAELARTRERTWKFCVYQALIALLVKTQLRYKYVWSANVDYIYHHAWLLFVHVGYLNVNPNQRFDDVLVYNYKYSVELQLVHELKDAYVPKVSLEFIEKTLIRQREKARRELTIVKSSFGSEKIKDNYHLPIHKLVQPIEDWFDKLECQYTNCIVRTPWFSLAFWKDGCFWYVYNPYRCDHFGFWNDEGYACIVKFCSRDSLRRHLIILTLRAYAFERFQKRKTYVDTSSIEKQTFTIQIYQMIYHSCKIHNVKLYNRCPSKPRPQLVEKKKSNCCIFDPYAKLAIENKTTCAIEAKETAEVKELDDKMEKPQWVENMKISWVKSKKKNECDESVKERAKWHNFQVIEPRRLYVLWGENHITDHIFDEANRGKQAEACYAACAAMSLLNTPEYWNGEILNAIVVCGDRFYTERSKKILKSVNPPNVLLNQIDEWNNQLTYQLTIIDMKFDVKVLPVIHGRLYMRNNQCLWRSLEQFFFEHRFGIFTCESTRLGIFKHCHAFYICDVSSYGPPIFEAGHGCAYLLRASCMFDLVSSMVLIIGSPECSNFTIRPLEIGNIVDVGDKNCGKKKSEICEDEICKSMCPFEDEKRKAKKKGCRKSTVGGCRKVKRVICSEKDD